jgi:nicotinamidase/pyrazinamidase
LRDDIIFWAVDVQADFMLPGGKLYVPGAENILPHIRRLVDVARADQVFLVSHGCIHPDGDPEFAQFPPHCLEGSDGAKFVSEALADRVAVLPNHESVTLPDNLLPFQQILLEKQTLDIFESRHAASLVERLPRSAEIVVFGVVTEYCVRFAAKGLLERGRRVSVVRDAIETLNPDESRKTLEELVSLGAALVTTDEILARCQSLSAG